MPWFGAVRWIPADPQDCPGGKVKAKCEQKQVYERVWYYFYLGGAWIDSGPKVCVACPSGRQAEDEAIIVCCFEGAYALLPDSFTGPGLIGFLEEHVAPDFITDRLGPTPTVMMLTKLGPCHEVNAATLRALIDNLGQAEIQLRATGRNSEADQNKKAIECLKERKREFGW